MSNEYPAPILPKTGKTSKYSGATFIANPALKGKNPRQSGTHGHRFHQIVANAGAKGITYEELKKEVEREDSGIIGFSNHLQWDLERHFIVIKK